MLNEQQIQEILDKNALGWSNRQIARELLGRDSRESTVRDILKRQGVSGSVVSKPPLGAKIVTLDIETAPIRGAVWRLFKQNVGLNQIENDWFIMSYCAKWKHKDDVIYEDLQGIVKEEDDSHLLASLWKILDEADIVVTQNGKKFDTKKINARLIIEGFQPPSSYKQVDTLEIAKRRFGFTSNKLEYMTDKICTKYKKLSHAKFPGYELWAECLKDNPEAWLEMSEYNKVDVLSLEELYEIMAPWDNKHPNLNLYQEGVTGSCVCGDADWIKYGYAYTNLSKFQRYRCKSCGAEKRGRTNLLDKDKRQSLGMNVL